MNGTTILLWITILIIGVIAIILVKLHYRGDELEKDEESIIPTEAIDNLLSNNKNNNADRPLMPNYSNVKPAENLNSYENIVKDNKEVYPAYTVENNNLQNIEYESQNQVLINYENEVKKTQEPMKEYQVEIMTSDNNQNEKHELKDLFTIDELIKESKRKDSEREKESQQITKDDADDLTEIKESIKKRQENEDVEEPLIEEVFAEEEAETKEETIQDILDAEESKEETIQDIINTEETSEVETEEQDIPEVEEEVPEVETTEETIKNIINDENNAQIEIETPEFTSQKDVEEAITSASQEIEPPAIEEISQSDNITDVLLNSEEEIKEPALKTPTKITENKDEFGASIDDANLFEPETNELDYRNDLNKIKNTIKGSKLFQDVKEKLRPEPEEEIDPIADLEETYIRNVNEYEDEYAPIINETHDDFGEIYEPDYDEAIRQENTRRLFETDTIAPEIETAKPKMESIKPKPSRGSIKIQLNNNEAVLKKGDEIIFKYDGDTYSSQVYAINGDDISVKYRRKNIKIKPEDVKKIY